MAQPSPLRDMVKNAVTGTTYAKLAARAVDPRTETRLVGNFLHRVANGGPARIPDAAHLAAIASAVDLPYEFVWLAAVVQYMPGTDGPLKEMLDATLARLLETHEAEKSAKAAEARRAPGDETAQLAARRAKYRAEALEAIANAHRLVSELEQGRQRAA